MITFDDFKPKTDESEHLECVFPVFTQHKLPLRPVITIPSHTQTQTQTHTHAAPMPGHAQICTRYVYWTVHHLDS